MARLDSWDLLALMVAQQVDLKGEVYDSDIHRAAQNAAHVLNTLRRWRSEYEVQFDTEARALNPNYRRPERRT